MHEALPSDDEATEAELDLQKTRLLFRNAGMAQTVTVINGAVLLFVLGGLEPPAWAIAWWLATAALAAARYELARRFLARNPVAANTMRWRRLAVGGALVGGLLWGGGGIAMMLADPVSTRLFTALVLAGMVAGAVPILSAVPDAFRAYAATVMLAIVLTAVLDAHGVRDWMLALVALLFLFSLLRSARYFHDALDSSIRLALHMQHMAKQLEEARRGAEAASNAKSQFLATMSHEIRTPLNGILGMAQVLLKPSLGEEEREDYTRTILDSGQTLLMLLNDILDLSKVEAGKLELNLTACKPGQIVAETVALFAETAHSKNLRIEAEWQGDKRARYWADSNRLRQMLSNLTNNAIKFTPQGFVRISAFEVERSAEHALLEFSVTDSGVGIPGDRLSTLFQAFVQVDSSDTRQFGGTGLGLSIVRLLAQLMGGDVGVESEPGHGSRFWFRVRVKAMAPGAESQHGDANDAPGGTLAASVPMQTARILVVEDNLVNRKVVEAMLTKRGLQIDCVENGLLAVEAVTGGEAPDLILMDCQMPVMDGYEATERVRQWEQANARPRLPIIALTAGAFSEDRDRCVKAGMDDFLTKPVSLADLDAMIERWLRAH